MAATRYYDKRPVLRVCLRGVFFLKIKDVYVGIIRGSVRLAGRRRLESRNCTLGEFFLFVFFPTTETRGRQVFTFPHLVCSALQLHGCWESLQLQWRRRSINGTKKGRSDLVKNCFLLSLFTVIRRSEAGSLRFFNQSRTKFSSRTSWGSLRRSPAIAGCLNYSGFARFLFSSKGPSTVPSRNQTQVGSGPN